MQRHTICDCGDADCPGGCEQSGLPKKATAPVVETAEVCGACGSKTCTNDLCGVQKGGETAGE